MKRLFLLILVLVLLSAGAWHRFLRPRHDTGIPEFLTLYGNVEIHQADLAFRVGGRIEDMHRNEGDRVETGDVLARLDARPFQDEVRGAEAGVAAQQARLDKLRAGNRPEEVAQAKANLEAARASADNARSNYDRVGKLRVGGGVSQQNLEDARAAYLSAKAGLDAARKQYALMKKGSRVEDIAAQQAALDAAEADLAKARTALEDTVLTASEGGTVLTRVREKGAVVRAGQTVYTVSLTTPVHIRAFVRQPQLGLIRPGMPVSVSVDAVPGKMYPGTVGYISPMAEFTPQSVETREVRNDLVFRLRILAQDPDNVLRQGMPVTVVIPVARPEALGESHGKDPA